MFTWSRSGVLLPQSGGGGECSDMPCMSSKDHFPIKEPKYYTSDDPPRICLVASKPIFILGSGWTLPRLLFYPEPATREDRFDGPFPSLHQSKACKMKANEIIAAIFSPPINSIILSISYHRHPLNSLFDSAMSIILARSPEDCETTTGQRAFEVINKSRRKKLLLIFSSGFGLILMLILLIWMILHPSKPKFTLKEADINQFNLSDPHLLTSSIQLTLQTENPNSKVGIYYDEIRVCAVYKGHQITADVSIPPFYQGCRDNNLLSASLEAHQLTIDSSLGYKVGRDQNEGKITLNMRIEGRIRWKVGTWVSRRYQLNANCYVQINFGPNNPITPSGTNQGSRCSTSL